jgi:hypothetical protein
MTKDVLVITATFAWGGAPYTKLVHIEHAFFDDLQGLPVQLSDRELPLIGTSGTNDSATMDYSPEVQHASRDLTQRLLAPLEGHGRSKKSFWELRRFP